MRNFALAVLALATVSGCGSNPYVSVRGSISKGGQPVTVDAEKDQWLQVTLIALGSDGSSIINSFGANVTDDGRFDVPGPEGNGVPPGKYRLAVQMVTYKNRGKDEFKNEFNDKSSPIVRDIQNSTNLAIDLDKPSE